MMPVMPVCRRAIVATFVVFGCVLLAAAPAAAARSALRAASPLCAIDLETLARAAARDAHVRFDRMVTADIDRDGDLDLIASTDHGFMVWVNDGAGHFTRQAPRRAPVADGALPGPSWQGWAPGAEQSVPN